MSIISIAKPPLGSLDQLEQVMAIACRPDEPAGLLHRFAGQADDGTVRVVAHWESREAALEFMAHRLGPALASVLGPEPAGLPDITWVEVANRYTRESLHA